MPTVIEASQQMEVSEAALSHLSEGMAPDAAVKALRAAGLVQDALKLTARLLPKSYAVAWACQCARAEPLGMEARAGAALAEAWVRDPNEQNRRAAYEFAHAGGYKSVGAWLAATAGWASGSLAPAAQQVPVPPPDQLTAKATVAAVSMLAAQVAEKFDERLRKYMDSAMGLLGPGSLG